ncbi:MAG TPA: hypothetical protein VF053_03970 [Streptosporangiales bacterium]
MARTRSTRRLPVAALTAVAAVVAAVVAAGGGTAHAAPPANDGWQVVATRLAPEQEAIWDHADATRPDDVWVAGVQDYDYEEASGTPAVGHWNGSSWRVYVFPVADDISNVTGLSAAAPDDVWVTYNEVATKRIYHYDGTYWTRKVTRGSGRKFGDITAVPGHAWTLATDHSVATYNGQTWTSKKIIDSGTLDHLESRTSKDVWAYGNAVEAPPGHVPTTYQPLAVHWNGKAWARTTMSSSVKDCAFTDLTAVGGKKAWAKCVGYDRKSETSWWDVLRWDGRTWRKVLGPVDGESGAGLTANAAGEVWAGSAHALWHFDGRQWQHTPLPQPKDRQPVLDVAARDLAAVPGSHQVVAAGSAYLDPGADGDYPPQFDVVWRRS